MPRRTALLVLVCSVVVLASVVAAWALWPDAPRRADLVEVSAPADTTTTATPTTDTTVPAGPASVPSTTVPPPVGVDPVALRIPSLGVDAAVVPVGLRDDGQMEIPAARDVGWYRLGPRPGANGSAVLAAHIDFGGEQGAFFDLPSLQPGQDVVVVGPDGAEQRYVVFAREQVAKADADLARWFTAEGPPRLTLITCGGAFNPDVRHYEDNIIVTAVPV